MHPVLESARSPRQLLRSSRGRFGAAAVVALLCALAIGCGEDDPVNPGNGNGDQGYIAGTAFPQGDASRAAEIKVEIFRHSDDEKVSTVFPNGEGRFVSDALDGNNYYLIASLAADGYFPAQMDNITVIGGRTTDVGIIDVPDTSSVRFEQLTPVPLSLQVERRPVISGEMRSAGSGFKLNTFFLEVNSGRVTPLVTEITPNRLARFTYSPSVNLLPGVVQVRAGITNQAGHLNTHIWAFRVLDGIARRVPQDFANIQEAVIACNDGDTVLVAAGSHFVDNVLVNKDLSFIGEDGQETTTLVATGSRHLHLQGVERQVVIKGFTFSGGRALGQEPGGAIFCENVLMTIEDCTFTDNEARLFRGGAVAMYRSNSRIRRCTFVDNHAQRGGAIVVYDRSGPEISHCMFTRNTGSGGGGAIFVKAATALVRNCGFLKNSMQGGGGAAIFADFESGSGANIFSEANLYVQNIGTSTTGVLHFNGSFISSRCDGFHDNQALLIDGTSGNSQQENLTEVPGDMDPGFCNLPAEDLHLMKSSPFVNETCERGPYPPGCNR
jgi:predicted outer membrane repeat protein